MTNPFGRLAMLRAAVLVTASTYLSYGVSIVVGAIVARSLGPEEYGQYAYVVWLTGLLVTLSNNGITTSGIRFVSESLGGGHAEQAGHVQHWLFRLQCASIIAVLSIFAAWAIGFPSPGWQVHPGLFMAIVAACVVTKSIYLFNVSIAKGHGNFLIEPMGTTLFALLSGAVSLLLAARHAGVLSFIYLFCATSFGIQAFVAWMVRRAGISARRGPIDPPLMLDMRQHLLWSALLAISVTFGSRSVETYILASRFGADQVAYYTIAGGLMRASAELLTVGLSAVLLPAMSRAYGAGGVDMVRPIFSDSLRYLVFIGLLLAGGGALVADPVVRLMYGTKYLAVIPVLQAMLICTGVGLSEATTGSLLTTTGRQRTRAWVVFGNLAVAVPLAVGLVPRYGLAGATLSYALSRITYSVAIGIIALRATGTRLPAARLLRMLAAAAIGSAAALTVASVWPTIAGWIVAGFLYALLLTALSILLGAWTPHDVDLARQVVDRSPRALNWVRPLLLRWREHYAR